MQYKKCNKCGEIKPATKEYFYAEAKGKYGLRPECKTCKDAMTKNWRMKNHKKIASQMKEWRVKNRDYYKKYRKEYYGKNRDEINEARRGRWLKNDNTIQKEKMKLYYQKNKDTPQYQRYRESSRTWLKEKRETDPIYKIKNRLRSRLNYALKNGEKSESTEKLIGCDFIYFKKYFFSLFVDDMTITDFMNGKIHIDHIAPLSFFDLEYEDNQKKAFHYTNMQPLWAIDNLRKQDKMLIRF